MFRGPAITFNFFSSSGRGLYGEQKSGMGRVYRAEGYLLGAFCALESWKLVDS
jgi:hypothetical protein